MGGIKSADGEFSLRILMFRLRIYLLLLNCQNLLLFGRNLTATTRLDFVCFNETMMNDCKRPLMYARTYLHAPLHSIAS